ncbi:MAG: heme exporter protein CcmB [Hyphomicrobiales bacterium]|nr:heme exporter protein CcmB [Hyphomicrobiales bacterium]
MRSAALALFLREWRVTRRLGGGAAMAVIFFLILITIVPFAIGPDPRLLGRIGAAILWIAALLATLIGLDRLFQADAEDGSLDLLRLGNLPLELVVLVKCAAHWLATIVPLVIAAPLFGLLLAMPAAQLWTVTLTLLIGTPALTLLGAIGAGLTAGLRRGGLLMPVLILPFTIPVLIFGVAAANAGQGAGFMPLHVPLLVLTALTLATLALAPLAAAWALRAGAS